MSHGRRRRGGIRLDIQYHPFPTGRGHRCGRQRVVGRLEWRPAVGWDKRGREVRVPHGGGCQSSIRSNSSQVPIAVRLAISGDAPAFSAVTIMLLARAFRLMLPSGLWMSWNVSHPPTAVRLAISGWAPACSAVTIMLFACARSAMPPLPRSISSNSSQPPIAVLLAISADAPALPAVTIMLLACARRLITGVDADAISIAKMCIAGVKAVAPALTFGRTTACTVLPGCSGTDAK